VAGGGAAGGVAAGVVAAGLGVRGGIGWNRSEGSASPDSPSGIVTVGIVRGAAERREETAESA
jgi:hypothetical protein